MEEINNLLTNVTNDDRVVFISALKEFPKEARQYANDSTTASFNKKLAMSAKNKIEVKASRFSADEIRILYLALFLLNEKVTKAETNDFSDKMNDQVHATLEKSLPILEDFVNNLLE